jgi:hypothetical protein
MKAKEQSQYHSKRSLNYSSMLKDDNGFSPNNIMDKKALISTVQQPESPNNQVKPNPKKGQKVLK